jgi:hypothetical protein
MLTSLSSWELPDNVFRAGETKPQKKTKVIKRKVTTNGTAIKKRPAEEVCYSPVLTIRTWPRNGRGEKKRITKNTEELRNREGAHLPHSPRTLSRTNCGGIGVRGLSFTAVHKSPPSAATAELEAGMYPARIIDG